MSIACSILYPYHNMNVLGTPTGKIACKQILNSAHLFFLKRYNLALQQQQQSETNERTYYAHTEIRVRRSSSQSKVPEEKAQAKIWGGCWHGGPAFVGLVLAGQFLIVLAGWLLAAHRLS